MAPRRTTELGRSSADRFSEQVIGRSGPRSVITPRYSRPHLQVTHPRQPSPTGLEPLTRSVTPRLTALATGRKRRVSRAD